MSLELKQQRLNVTAETAAVLESESKVTGEDRSEIARRVLHQWAMEKIHASTLLQQALDREGLAPTARDAK